MVGVNRFTIAEEEPYEPLRVDPAIEAEQVERLRVLRAERDNDVVTAALDALKTPRRGTTTTCCIR